MTPMSCAPAAEAGQCRIHSPYKAGIETRIPAMSALANHAFAKMNGIGNEIVVVDLRDRPARRYHAG